jgi:hypothetical protein
MLLDARLWLMGLKLIIDGRFLIRLTCQQRRSASEIQIETQSGSKMAIVWVWSQSFISILSLTLLDWANS